MQGLPLTWPSLSYGERKLREPCQSLVSTGNLNRSLSCVYRSDLASLEALFLSELN